MKKVTILTTMAVLLVMSGVGQAKDYGPLVGWDRYANNATFAHWEFTTSDMPSSPEDFWNPNGVPFIELTTNGTGFWEWSNEWPCPEGMDPSGVTDGWHCADAEGGTIRIEIPNDPENREIKEIFMQMTTSKLPSGITVTGHGGEPGGYTSGTFPTGRPDYQEGSPPPISGEGSWYTYNWGFTIEPNPESETIEIEVEECTVVDQIVVDTRCMPEPATMSLFALSGLGLLWRKRR